MTAGGGGDSMFLQLFGGLALFLFGMEQMASGLKSAAGSKMKDILGRFTSTPARGAVTGGVVTAVIQSSSVTTVLTVGFVSAGLMTLTQSVGVIMGANVGTTITAQIVAFNVGKAALGMIAVGFGLLFVSKQERLRQSGSIIMGLGLVFFGMTLMGEAMHPMRSNEGFINFMSGMKNPALGIATGAVFTALVQSSSATTGIVIALASQRLIGLEAGISLIFGANIGTCVTALLAAIGKSREAIRVAWVHVIFNVFGVLIWLAFIPLLAQLVRWISPSADEAAGAADLASVVPRQIANAHAIFNITNTLLLLPLAGKIGALARRIVPDRPGEAAVKPKYLDREAITVPAMALHHARLEAARLGDHVASMLEELRSTILSSNPRLLSALARENTIINQLEAQILSYLGEVRQGELTETESANFQSLMVAVESLESIADVISDDFVGIGRRRAEKGLEASETMRGMLDEIYEELRSALDDAVNAIREDSREAAAAVLAHKPTLDRLVADVMAHQERRFREHGPSRLALFRLEMDLVEKMRHIYTLTKRIARSYIPKAEEPEPGVPEAE